MRRIQLLIFICIGLEAFSQGDTDFQTWTDVTINAPITKKATTIYEVGARGLISSVGWNQGFVRVSGKYGFNSLISLAAGGAYFLTTETEEPTLNELRFHQDLNITWPNLVFMDFKHRFRLEERFFFENNENSFDLRPRYKLNAGTRNIRILSKRVVWNFELEYERFFTFPGEFSETFSNRGRLTPIIGINPSIDWRVEVCYIWQTSREKAQSEFVSSENILRLRFFYFFRNKTDAELSGDN